MPLEILLQPIGVHPQILEPIRSIIEEKLDKRAVVKLSLWSLRFDYRRVFDWERGQLKALDVNEEVYRFLHDYIKPKRRIVVAVCSGDAYYGGLNFVFGLASVNLGVASVYTARLLEGSSERFLERLAKEILHEIGHLLGLDHCQGYCVMRFSNSLLEVDEKPAYYCSRCRVRIERILEAESSE